MAGYEMSASYFVILKLETQPRKTQITLTKKNKKDIIIFNGT